MTDKMAEALRDDELRNMIGEIIRRTAMMNVDDPAYEAATEIVAAIVGLLTEAGQRLYAAIDAEHTKVNDLAGRLLKAEAALSAAEQQRQREVEQARIEERRRFQAKIDDALAYLDRGQPNHAAQRLMEKFI